MIDITGALAELGIRGPRVVHDATPAALSRAAIRDGDCDLSDTGALIARSGTYTGRVPKAKRIVHEPGTAGDVWWGPVNIPFEDASFAANRALATAYLSRLREVYVVDGYLCWEPAFQVKVRVVCARPYHALFMRNMLVRPTSEQRASFGAPDWTIINAGQRSADTKVKGVDSDASIALHFGRREFLILGSQYAGEMKKGLFTLLNYLLPKGGHFPMHCSANEGRDGSTALFFGLSGTGKTTLSADPERALLGDDEHGWWDGGVFNFEGGCYAKTINLSREKEPQIWDAIRFGAVLENVGYDHESHVVDYADAGITENTRVCYPVEHIANAKIPAVGGHPRHVVFLTCDATGVLPPVSRLTAAQAMYHFISGYTAKVAGTEAGVKEPEATFSSCFGQPFLVWHPTVYARLLKEKITTHRSTVWLVNTGWTRGPYGVGQRMPLPETRAILRAVLSGELEGARYVTEPHFGLSVPEAVAGVTTALLLPERSWPDPEMYRAKALELARKFHANFDRFRAEADPEVIAVGPLVGRP